MPGQVSVRNAKGSPTPNPDADRQICVIGASTKNPVSAGQVTPPYSDPTILHGDLGEGDMVDCAAQALNRTPGNPSPAGVSVYHTPSTTAGSYGTIAYTVAGTAIPANDTSVSPTGTLQPWLQVVNGFSVGTTGGTAWASLDGGRTKTLVQIGTLGYYDFPANDGFANQAGFSFGLPTSLLSALYTGLNNLRTAALGHFTDVSGSPAVHLASDTTDETALTAVATATTPATAVALYNALVTILETHMLSTTYHTVADTTDESSVAGLPVAHSTSDVALNLLALQNAYNAHRVLVGSGPVHGSADSTNTCASYTTPTAPTFLAGDVMSTNTLPPSWGDTDLYNGGPTPPTGAFASIGQSSQVFGLVVVSEPVASGDFATLVAGLNYLQTFNKRPSLIIRFRDQQLTGETTAQYIAAATAFLSANHDNRITCVVGGGWLTDALTARVYQRSGLPAVLARLQGMNASPGQEGEVLAQSPGWGQAGPLEGFSLVDGNGNLVFGAVDGFTQGGLDGPIGSGGGALNFCYQRDPETQGTYVSSAPCMYGVGDTVLTLMDSRVTNGIMRELYSIGWTFIQAADIVQNGQLDPDVCTAMASAMRNRIRRLFANEIANPDDPNLVVVNPAVTVIGANVTINVSVNDKLFDYTNGINITLYNVRS